MPWIAPLVSAGVGLVGSALEGSGGGYGGSYLPPNLTQAANTEMGLIPTLSQNNLYQQYLPQTQNALNTALGSQYYNPMMTAASQAGQQYGTAGTNAMNYGTQLGGQIGQTLAAGNQLYQTAFDPNQALYNQQFAQNQNQTNANLAARGLNMSGAGAQIANQSNQNFNTAWQQQQLQNQLAGVQGLASAEGAASGLSQYANQAQQLGAQNTLASGTVPYSTQLNALQGQLGLIGTAGGYGQQSNVPTQQMISDYNAYQGLGSPSSQLAQSQSALSGISSLGSGLGSLASSAYNSPYSSNFGTAFSYGTNPYSQQTSMLAAQDAGF